MNFQLKNECHHDQFWSNQKFHQQFSHQLSKKSQNRIIWLFWSFKKHIKSYQNYFSWFFHVWSTTKFIQIADVLTLKQFWKKWKKSNYFVSKSYRIITLLNCLKKISKKIIVKRLSYLKQISNMLDFDQINERKNQSAIDAILNLTHDIQLTLKQKLITSCLFLNVKKAFDHVSTNQLLIILIKLNLPIQLKNWVNNFMNNRSIALAFDDQKQHTRQIKIDISQKSSISSILFFIYIRFLFSKIQIKVQTNFFSFIDDIQINVSSKNIENNCKTLLFFLLIQIYSSYAINIGYDRLVV